MSYIHGFPPQHTLLVIVKILLSFLLVTLFCDALGKNNLLEDKNEKHYITVVVKTNTFLVAKELQIDIYTEARTPGLEVVVTHSDDWEILKACPVINYDLIFHTEREEGFFTPQYIRLTTNQTLKVLDFGQIKSLRGHLTAYGNKLDIVEVIASHHADVQGNFNFTRLLYLKKIHMPKLSIVRPRTGHYPLSFALVNLPELRSFLVVSTRLQLYANSQWFVGTFLRIRNTRLQYIDQFATVNQTIGKAYFDIVNIANNPSLVSINLEQ